MLARLRRESEEEEEELRERPTDDDDERGEGRENTCRGEKGKFEQQLRLFSAKSW